MTLLDLSLLGLLADQPLHGYELKKRLGELVEGRPTVSFGSLYPALNRLDRDELVRGDDATEPMRSPMTGSLGAEVAAMRTATRDPATRSRRTRKVYAITPKGQARLEKLIVATPADDRTFAVQLAFCRHVTPDERLALLRRRHVELTTRLAGDDLDVTRVRDRYRRVAHDRDRLGYEAELVWLDHLIEEELDLLEPSSSSGTVAGPDPSRTPLPDPAVGGSPQ